jgi:ribosomal protein S17E
MEQQPKTNAEEKIGQYVNRIESGESKGTIFKDLPESFKTGIDKKLIELENERNKDDQEKIDVLRKKLDVHENVKVKKNPPINYMDVVIDDEYIQKNLMSNGGLRMMGGQANWNNEVDLMRYIISDKLSVKYLQIATEKIEKNNSWQEKIYQHESHHIKNREQGLTPHLAAENLREFLAFRVLDELSAFMAGELHNQDITVENILSALRKAEQMIVYSYYSGPFTNEAKWYLSQHGNEQKVLSREINQEKYHQIMKHYFNINENNVLAILQKSNKMPEFTKIVNDLIVRLDTILKNN